MSIQTYWVTTKAIIFTMLILFILFTSFKTYTWVNNKLAIQQCELQVALDKARVYKKYSESLVRANTTIVSSLKNDINALDVKWDKVLDDIKKRDEKITNIGNTVAQLNKNIKKLRTKSDHTYKAGTGKLNEQYFIDIMYPVKNKKGETIKEIPYAWAIFYPNKSEDQKWKYGIYSLEYHSKTVQSKQRDGQTNTYMEMWFENNKRKISKDYKVPVKIKSSEFKQLQIKSKQFFWWNPRLSLNLDYGVGLSPDQKTGNNNVGGGVSMSFMGYGKTKNDLTLKFIDIGLSGNNDAYWAKFSPLAYNIGNHIFLINNTFVGPFVGYDFKNQSNIVGISLSVPF